jgi:hypothetical protein
MRVHPGFVVLAVPFLAAAILTVQFSIYGPSVDQPSSDAAHSDQPAASVSESATFTGALQGSTWKIVETDGETDQFRFGPGNVLHRTGSSGDTSADAVWNQQGDSLSISFNNGYATYTGHLSGTHLEGTAGNQRGLHWAWSGDLVSPPAAAAPSTRQPSATPAAIHTEPGQTREALRKKKIATHLTAAQNFWSNGQIQDAISECDAVLHLDPNNEQAASLKIKYQKAQALLNGTSQ